MYVRLPYITFYSLVDGYLNRCIHDARLPTYGGALDIVYLSTGIRYPTSTQQLQRFIRELLEKDHEFERPFRSLLFVRRLKDGPPDSTWNSLADVGVVVDKKDREKFFDDNARAIYQEKYKKMKASKKW